MPGNKNSGQQKKVIKNSDIANDTAARVAIIPKKKRGGRVTKTNNLLSESTDLSFQTTPSSRKKELSCKSFN